MHFVFHFCLDSCLLPSLSDSVALHGLEWLGMVWACASRLWAPGARFRHFGHFGQGGALNIIIVFGVFRLCFIPGYFRAFSVFSNTPIVAGAIHVRTGRNAIGLAQNLEQFTASLPNRLFLLPPCGPLVLASPPFGLVGAWAAPPFVFLSFSFPFFPPLLVTCSR